jgi:hypothetical protein
MPRRLLNIASIVCLVLCVALMGLWVRSQHWHDNLSAWFTNRCGFGISSVPGRVIAQAFLLHQPMIGLQGTMSSSPNAELWVKPFHQTGSSTPLNFVTRWGFAVEPVTAAGGPPGNDGYTIIVPYWFLVMTSGILAMLFQLRWPLRFTLRSLFIVTTFLAVVLGMIAWLDLAWIGK